MRNMIIIIVCLLISLRSTAQWGQLNSTTSFSINDIFMITDQVGLAVGDSGLILKTTNAGLNWTTITCGCGFRDLRSVDFVDAEIGHIVGFDSTYLYTNNAGGSWSVRGLPLGVQDLNAVKFQSVNNGIAVGANGYIMVTTDAGNNFVSKVSGTIYALNDIEYLSAAKILVVGSGGKILTSNDAGANWSLPPISPTSAALSALHFVTDSLGYVVGSSGTVLRTEDAGANWSTMFTGSTTWFQDIFCEAFDKCVIAGTAGEIMRSTKDSVWSTEYSTTTNTIQSLFFIDKYSGYAGAKNGTLLRTCPVGEIAISSGPAVVNQDVQFIDSSHNSDNVIWYMMGDSFLTPNPTVTFTTVATELILQVSSNASGCKDSVTLSLPIGTGIENIPQLASVNLYPNPFRGSTRLSYDLLNAEQIRISIFDLLGKETEVLYNAAQRPGKHELELSPGPGIFFLRIKVGQYAQSLKLIGF